MTETIGLKEAERKVFRTKFQDGLWDVFIGCFVLIFAVAPLISVYLGDFWSSAVFLPFWALVYAGVVLVRKHVVIPRLGSVTFGPTLRKRLTRLSAILAFVNLFVFAAGILVFYRSGLMSGRLFTMGIGLMVLLLSSVAGTVLACPRFFFYGLLFFLSFPVGEWLYQSYGAGHHGFPITFGVTSGILIVIGILMFIRFVRRYPVPKIGPIPEGNQHGG